MSKRKSLAATITPAAEKFVSGSKESKTASKQDGKLETITVRIPAELARRLRLASGTRAADRVAPYKPQDIVAAAVDAWLKANNF